MVTRISSLLFAALLSLAGAQSFAATPQALKLQSSQSYYYAFGSWPVGYTTFQDFSFTSYGGLTRIYSIYTFGTAYNSIDNCPSILYAGYSCTIRVFFRPWFVGYQDGQTTISTDSGTTRVFLSGYGY
ncbi:MAG: hypothetical protein JSU04_05945 [Bdellovibrionales bacterium]|nr:hypothetical protein [Bdellovibrionales bacterium]